MNHFKVSLSVYYVETHNICFENNICTNNTSQNVYILYFIVAIRKILDPPC